MNILIIDAQGGGIDRQLISHIKRELPDLYITAVGTNSMATTAMLKAGANQGATGENSVAVACRRADIIIGPIGIIVADSMISEITPSIANAITQANAERILIPFSNCNTYIAGMSDIHMRKLINAAIDELRNLTSR